MSVQLFVRHRSDMTVPGRPSGLCLVKIIAFVCLARTTAGSNEDWKHWYDQANVELERAIRTAANTNTAKNIIVFIGDGMGVSTLTAARIYKGQQKNRPGEGEKLSFEEFPHVSLSKTYNVDRQVADSAGTATAYWCGFKANFGTLGVDAGVKRGQCTPAALLRNNTCLLDWAQSAGKKTGIVTNTRITHATPAALYAKSADRNWECFADGANDDDDDDANQCPDIARQMVEHDPGRQTNVIFGGGRQMFIPNINSTKFSPASSSACERRDNRNLIDQWLKDKQDRQLSATFVTNTEELDQLDTSIDHVLGLFANSHMSYENERDTSSKGQPSLAKMVQSAIEILSTGKNGFFLAVEGGRIDHAHHNTKPRQALSETVALDEAVQVALKMTSVEDTLIVVTADHSHVFTIQGYPKRGADILGAVEKSDVDGLPYPTLQYSNGPSFKFRSNGTAVQRFSLDGVDTTDWSYRTPTGIPMEDETHGGEDVAIFATGPWAHLFHGVHEQNYIAHVAAYAARIGPRKHCTDLLAGEVCGAAAGAAPTTPATITTLLIVVYSLCKMCLLVG